MKNIIRLLLLCASCAFTVQAQTLVELKASFATAQTPGAKWASVENWAAQQVAAAQADKSAALAVVQAKLDAANAAQVALVAKLQSATTPALLATLRTEALAPEVDARRAKLAAELAAKQAELDALK